jgi:hypothetical protein
MVRSRVVVLPTSWWVAGVAFFDPCGGPGREGFGARAAGSGAGGGCETRLGPGPVSAGSAGPVSPRADAGPRRTSETQLRVGGDDQPAPPVSTSPEATNQVCSAYGCGKSLPTPAASGVSTRLRARDPLPAGPRCALRRSPRRCPGAATARVQGIPCARRSNVITADTTITISRHALAWAVVALGPPEREGGSMIVARFKAQCRPDCTEEFAVAIVAVEDPHSRPDAQPAWSRVEAAR